MVKADPPGLGAKALNGLGVAEGEGYWNHDRKIHTFAGQLKSSRS